MTLNRILSVVTTASLTIVASTSVILAQPKKVPAPIEVAKPERTLDIETRRSLFDRFGESFGEKAKADFEAKAKNARTEEEYRMAAINAYLSARDGMNVELDKYRQAESYVKTAFANPAEIKAPTTTTVVNHVNSIGKPVCPMVRNSSVVSGDYLTQKDNFGVMSSVIYGDPMKMADFVTTVDPAQAANIKVTPLSEVMGETGQTMFWSIVSSDPEVQQGGKVLLDYMQTANVEYQISHKGSFNMGELREYVWENGVIKALLDAGETRENAEKFKKECPVL